jgi:hypothetical protein
LWIKGDGKGALYIMLSCHHNLISTSFTLQSLNNTNNVNYVNGNLVVKDFTDLFEKVGNETTYELNHNGEWDTRIEPGLYLVTLLDGNGGQPEYAIVRVVEKHSVYVVFIGHGVSMGSDDKEEVVCYVSPAWDETIVDEEGWDETIVDVPAWTETIPAVTHPVHHDAVTHIVHHEAITHPETIVDTPAWDETVIDTPAYDETIIDVPAHTEYRVKGHWDYYWWNHYWDHSNSWSSWSDNIPDFYSEIPNNDKQTRNVEAVTHPVHHDAVTHIVHHEAITHTETIVDTPAWDETVEDEEGWDEIVVDVPERTVPHDAVTHTLHHDETTHVVHHEEVTRCEGDETPTPT